MMVLKAVVGIFLTIFIIVGMCLCAIANWRYILFYSVLLVPVALEIRAPVKLEMKCKGEDEL